MTVTLTTILRDDPSALQLSTKGAVFIVTHARHLEV